VYERRYPGLDLSEFDRLAAQSTVFTHTVPAGIYTQAVVPSLMTGNSIDVVSSSADGRLLSVHDPESDKWSTFDQHEIVFQDALNAGYRTAIAGWFNPYCRILPSVLDQCFWTSQQPPEENESYLARSQTLTRLLAKVLQITDIREHAASLHISDYHGIYAAGDRMLADSSDNFLFIHMCIPHPGGIYNRATGSLATKNSTYLNNLALADRYLTHVRSLLEQKGQWDSSTVIVMGDHSWRTSLLWASGPEWTNEEQIASDGGQFDDRPAYIVKLPNQHQEVKIDTPFAATNTRKLLDLSIEGKMQTPEELKTWVASIKSPNQSSPGAVMSR
jgi:hypothetical protein